MDTYAKCLVSGGAGFIGSHLCDALITRGDEVYCIDNLLTGSKENIAHLHSHRRFHFVYHDISKPLKNALLSQAKGIDFIYHLASPASPPLYRKYSIETLLVNSLGTYLMLELARGEQAQFLLASTSEVYGDPMEHPQKESYVGHVNPVGIRACYDEGKRFAEAITMEYFRKYQVDARIVRIFNTYGPRMDPSDGRVIINFLQQALARKPLTVYGDGRQTRSFCYISDMVEGLLRAMEHKGMCGEVVNLGYPEEHTIREIAQIILDLTNSSSKITFLPGLADDPKKRKPDISKAKRLLHWQPQIPLTLGLSQTLAYYQRV